MGCAPESTKPQASTERELETIAAALITIEPQTWPTIVRSQGSLIADEQTEVGAKVAGRVAEVHIELGDAVEVGDVLIGLDLNEFQLQVVQAEAQLQQSRAAVGLSAGASTSELDPDNAPPVRQEKAAWAESKSSLERAERLLKQKAISQGEYDLALAAERMAEARHASSLNSVREKIALIGIREADLSLARQRLQDATICAPLDGYVRSRQVAEGAFVSIGQAIATIVRTDPLRFRGSVPERYAQALRVGQEVRLKGITVDPSCVTTITRVSPALDSQSRALVFEADVPNPGQTLRAGIFAEAEIVIDTSAQALVIPNTALNEFAGVEKVWKVVDGVATEQEVLAGPLRDEGREILQGLSRGDRILLHADQGRVARVTDVLLAPDPAPDPAIGSAVAAPRDRAEESKDSQG